MNTRCPYCSKELIPRVSIPKDWCRTDIVQQYEIFECKYCNYGHILPRPEAKDIPGFYKIDSYYTHQRDGLKNQEHSFTFLQRLRHHLAWRMDKGNDPTKEWWAATIGSKPLTILEVGCGNGQHLKKLEELGHEVLGIEPDQQAIETAVSNGCTVYEGTAENIPTEILSKKFEVVLMSHVLEHTLDPILALENTSNLLSENGRLIIEVPNNDSLGRKIIGKYWAWLDVPRHLNFFGLDSLKLACSKSGLNIDKLEYRGYSRQFSSNWLATEKRIFSIFEDNQNIQLSDAIYWNLFLRTAFSSAKKKYDSVRVVASRTAV